MNHNNNQIVTRFAPSPTGFLHIGSVRTALFAYLYAKKHHGTFILRIEDTDKVREVEGSVEHIQEAMQWLGIHWDYGPDKPGDLGSCLQSDRLDVYTRYANILIEKGLAYPEPYSTEEIASFRDEAQKQNKPFLYRAHRPDSVAEWDGKTALRFKTPEIKRYHWHDEVRGDLSAGEEMLDDIVLIKADGYPTYNFAHIVDDIEMKVTHVMRGEEFIPSTPKYLSIYDALDTPYPKFVTLPPIMGPDGKKKLSKRDGAKDLLEYRTDGFLPEAMRNFLALVGWNPGGDKEIYPSNPTDDSLVQAFSLEKIQKSGGAFNEEKLLWMNKQYLEMADVSFKTHYFTDALPQHILDLPQYDSERADKLAPVAMERIHNQAEVKAAATSGEYDYAFATPTYEVDILKWKKDDTVLSAKPRLEKVIELLKEQDFQSVDAIKQAIWEFAEEEGRGEVLWPLRVALSGREKSPDPFSIAYIIGYPETINRIKTACGKIIS
jgi:glutamyl-tRNA synthetase